MNWMPPTRNVLIAAGILLGLLLVASWVVAGLQRARPDGNFEELKLRVRSWWVIVLLFISAILLSGAAVLVLFAFISFLALKEYFSLIPTRRSDRRVLFWAYLAIPLQYWWAYCDWYGMFVIFIPVYMFLIIPMRLVALQDTDGFLRSVGTIQWGLMIAVFFLSHAAWLFVLPASVNPAGGSAGLLFFLVGLTELNDIFQYLWGKSLGRKKMLPIVSPNKTWVGFLGGVGTTSVLAAVVGPYLTPMHWEAAFVSGLIIGVAGFWGDVTVSALKRDLGIKDSGRLLPGHGGILDRVDSLVFTAPLFLHFIRYHYY